MDCAICKTTVRVYKCKILKCHLVEQALPRFPVCILLLVLMVFSVKCEQIDFVVKIVVNFIYIKKEYCDV
jgi:hypothetical protein